MKLRALLLFGLLGSVATAFASFEMMLMAGSEGVHRYDPQTNVLLGKFAEFDGPAFDVALDPTRPGEALTISDYGAVNRYDYNTGEFRGGFNVGGFSFIERPRISVLTNGNILYTAYTVVDGRAVTKVYSPTGSLIATAEAPNALYQALDAIQTPDGKIQVLSRAPNGPNFDFYVSTFNLAGNMESFATVQTGVSLSSTWGTLAWMNGRLFVSSGHSNTNPGRLAFWDGAITGTPTTVQVFSGAQASGATNYVGGHNGIGYMMHSFLETGVRKNRVIRYNPNSNIASSTVFVNGLTDTIYGSAIVVAPEPGTMIALGVGLAAVVRRRKNSA